MTKTLAELSKKLRAIDYCTLSTRTEGGAIAGRPMSNNAQVEGDLDAYFFSSGDARTVADIEADRHIGLAYQGKSGIVGQRPFFVTVEGEAELIRDKARFERHWTKDVERYFPDGIDTPGLTLIKVHAVRAHYWDGEEEGELKI